MADQPPAAVPPAKRLRDDEEAPAADAVEAPSAAAASELRLLARKSVNGAAVTVEVNIAQTKTVGDLAKWLAAHEQCDSSLVTIVCKGKVLAQLGAGLGEALAGQAGADGRIVVVYLVRKPAAAVAASADRASESSGGSAAASSTAASAPAPQPSSASSSSKESPRAVAAASQVAAANAAAAIAAAIAPPPAPAPVAVGDSSMGDGGTGRRVLLLLRHGQCCHENESDQMKALTVHGQRQAEESARYIAQLFASAQLPERRALLHSTSRRARETAAKLPQHLPGLEVWNSDILRETDPTKNPFRAEEVFRRIFISPPADTSDTLIVVAHNNIILYLLMRAAGVPIERAAEAWNLFHLIHASVTRIDVLASGAKQVIMVGAAGHIPRAYVTWYNLQGADLAEWSGEGPDRHKLSGRTVLLIRQASEDSERGSRQVDAMAAHVKGLSEFMVSAHVSVTCTAAAQRTANAVAAKFRAIPQVLPDSITDYPEAAFLQFFCPPSDHSRDTVVLCAEPGPLLYWLLRSLHMSPEDAKATAALYRIGHATITIVNIKPNGSMKVVAVGDNGHLPIDCR